MSVVEKIFEIIKNNLKNPKLYVAFVVMILIILLLFPYIDANFFYYNRVEKRITILQEFSQIHVEQIRENPVLLNEYESILSEISKQKDGSLGSIFITTASLEVRRNKFIFGALLPFLLGLLCVFIKMERRWYKLFGLIVFTILGFLLGMLATVIPTIFTPLCNYLLVPFLQIILLGLLLTSGNKNGKQVKDEE